MDIRTKRAYASPSAEDGLRLLVDRVWPRGLRKEAAHLDRWFKEIAPSTELRRWFGHDPARWEEFQRRYREELRDREEALRELRELALHHRVTLLFGAKEERFNNAVVLRDYLRER